MYNTTTGNVQYQYGTVVSIIYVLKWKLRIWNYYLDYLQTLLVHINRGSMQKETLGNIFIILIIKGK